MPEGFTERLILIALVLVLAIVIRLVLAVAIRRITRALLARGPVSNADDLGSRTRRFIAQASGAETERHRQRVTTLSSLLRNIVDIVVVTLTILTLLSIVGVPMTPLLASAGVGGLAIGFGAQSLVKDYISGIFMLAEDQFGVGDLIMVDDIKGEVLEVSLRVTKVREPGGTVWYLRNGEILTLGNISQGYSTAFVDVPVAFDEDSERVGAVLSEAVAGMQEEPEWADILLEAPLMLGVDSMTAGTMLFKIMLKTGPNQQWGAIREIRRRARLACVEAGIRGPILPLAPGNPA